jgi:hypothetical protein
VGVGKRNDRLARSGAEPRRGKRTQPRVSTLGTVSGLMSDIGSLEDDDEHENDFQASDFRLNQ